MKKLLIFLWLALAAAGQGGMFFGLQGGYDRDAQACFAGITSAGGTISTERKTAVSQLAIGLKSTVVDGASLWSRIKEIGPMAADGLTGCGRKLKYPAGAPDSLTLNNYVSGDYSPISGLKGDGSTKYASTGTAPSSYGITSSDMSFGIMATGATVNSTGALSTGVMMGAATNFYIGYSGNSANFGGVSVSHSNFEGSQIVTNRSSSGTVVEYYRKGVAYGTGSGTPGTVSGTVTLHRYNSSFYESSYLRLYFLGNKLTSGQAAALNTVLETYYGAMVSAYRVANATNVFCPFGDSITDGNAASDYGSTKAHSFASLVAAAKGMTLARRGISGTTLYSAGGTGEGNTGYERWMTDVASSAPSVVSINLGVNDVVNNTSYTATQYKDELRTLVQSIQRVCRLPFSKIIICSPSKVTNYGVGDATRHAAFVTACSDIATELNCPFVNMVTAMSGSCLSGDGIHANDLGMQQMADALALAF